MTDSKAKTQSHTSSFTQNGKIRLPFAFSGVQCVLALQLILWYHGRSAQLPYLWAASKGNVKVPCMSVLQVDLRALELESPWD